MLQNLKEETRKQHKSKNPLGRWPTGLATDKSCKSNVHGVEQAEDPCMGLKVNKFKRERERWLRQSTGKREFCFCKRRASLKAERCQ